MYIIHENVSIGSYSTETITQLYCLRGIGQGPVHTVSSGQQCQINSHSTHTCG